MKRSNKLERIDLGNYTQEEYRDCLKQLGRIGRLLGGDRATSRALQKIDHPIKTVLDIGCGGGQAAARLAQHYPEADVLGIDLNPEAIRYAREHHLSPNLRFEQQAEKSLDFPTEAFDLVHCSLVCHHMTWEELTPFLREAHRISRGTLLINDLRRSRLAWLLYGLVAPPLFRNQMITQDGLLSIRRSFVRKDWLRLEKESNLPNATWEVGGGSSGLSRWTIRIHKTSSNSSLLAHAQPKSPPSTPHYEEKSEVADSG